MPVIQLPTDTRFGDLGKAVGGAVGQIASAFAENKLSEGVAKILQDPSVADVDKPAEVFKQFGPQGSIKYGDLLKTQQQNAQIKDLLAQEGHRSVQTQILQKTLPTVGPQAEANLAGTQATTAGTLQTTEQRRALLPGQLAQQPAQTRLTQAEAAGAEATGDLTRLKTPTEVTGAAARAKLVGAEAAKTGTETELLQDQLTRNRKILEQGPTDTGTLDKMLDEAGITDPGQRAAAKMEYGANLYAKDPAKAGEAFAKSVTQSVNARASAKIRAEAPSEAGTKAAEGASEHAESLDRFLKSFTRGGAQKIGFVTGAGVKKWLEEHGVSAGDPEFVEMYNAAAQQVQSTATSGGGFYAEGRKRLAETVTPSVMETPLHAIISADQVADRMIARLKTRQLDHPEQKSIQSALDKWQDLKKTTGSLDTYDYVPDPKSPKIKYPVVLFNGDQVDLKTFKPLVEGARDYKLGKGTMLRGSDVIADARRRNMAPAVRLEEIKALYGSGLKGSQ
jgi:hypothetical protein